MPWVDPWPFAVHVAGFETDCECFGRYHGVGAWSWVVFIIIFDTRVVGEVVALGKHASGIEFLQLDESAKAEAEW